MKLTQVEYEEVERLVNRALGVRNKLKAEPYIKQLQFMHSTGGYEGYVNNLFGELVAMVESAAEQVRDKEMLCGFARTYLYRLSCQVNHDLNGGHNDE